MPTMVVGTAVLKKGEEYNGLVPLGNAIRVMDQNRRASISRGDMVQMPFNEDIFTLPSVTYLFEEDTAILLTRVVQTDLTIIYEDSSTDNIPLVQDVESAAIVTVTVLDPITTGTVQYRVEVENTANQSRDITVRVYNEAVLLSTDLYTLSSNSSETYSISREIIAGIAVDTELTLTVETDGDSCEIKGSEMATRLQIIRKT